MIESWDVWVRHFDGDIFMRHFCETLFYETFLVGHFEWAILDKTLLVRHFEYGILSETILVIFKHSVRASLCIFQEDNIGGQKRAAQDFFQLARRQAWNETFNGGHTKRHRIKMEQLLICGKTLCLSKLKMTQFSNSNGFSSIFWQIVRKKVRNVSFSCFGDKEQWKLTFKHSVWKL